MIETQGCEHLTANEFRQALVEAKPGEMIIYARGFLAFAIDRAASRRDRNIGQLIGVTSVAWEAHVRGDVCLTQRRIGDRPQDNSVGAFEYRATKRNNDGPRLRRV